ncbi:hypothetical protein BDA96_10G058500 [Sorghum bicolor]|uniref:DUF295 domain-containing protein n=2 Tax=Sorghum bicolor TaxID=4558 RepID=A0A921PZ99_SORBI|nr:hypothetical protein BDA96_10G058500 [Sorghum bicolor]KXG19377.1 hypothetical protein SORBI_3010G050000 [Sorghum bicolor]
MAAAAAARHCRCWADLRPELVALVLRRLPSLADRVRLGAVCRAWRRIAGEEPLPPPLPWLTLLDGTFLSISDGGEIHRMRVPEDASLHGSVGNWLFLRRLGGKLALMNAFSKCVVELPLKPNNSYYEDSMFFKIVPLSTLDLSSDFLFLVLIVTSTWQCVISIGQRPSSAIALKIPDYIFDIVFCEGKLYALSFEKLFAFEIVSSYGGGKSPSVSSMKHVANAVKNPGIDLENNGLQAKDFITISFEVFELDLTTNSHDKWRRLNTLGDQALFVGTYSKFLPASECGAQENCIYFMCDYDREHWTTDPLRDCGVFNMSNGTITPLLPDTTVVRPQGCKGLPTWFFPTKTM